MGQLQTDLSPKQMNFLDMIQNETLVATSLATTDERVNAEEIDEKVTDDHFCEVIYVQVIVERNHFSLDCNDNGALVYVHNLDLSSTYDKGEHTHAGVQNTHLHKNLFDLTWNTAIICTGINTVPCSNFVHTGN